MKIFYPLLIAVFCGCTSPPGMNLEGVARKVHSQMEGHSYGLFFRDLQDGETLEMSADRGFQDPKGRRLSVVGRVLEEVSSGNVSWAQVQGDLEKLVGKGDSEAGVRLISRLGRDAEHFLSPREYGRLVQSLFQAESSPQVQAFLQAHAKALGLFRSESGRLYILIALKNRASDRVVLDDFHAYMGRKS